MAADLAKDGLLQRFLPVLLKRINDGEDDYPDGELDKTVSKLPAVIAQVDRGRFRFAPEAAPQLDRVLEFKNQQRELHDSSPKLKEWLDKLPNEYGRLALAFHFIDWAGLPEQKRGASPPETVSRETAERARRYIIEFIYPQAVEFYCRTLGRSATEGHAIWIAEHILTQGAAMIKKRDIQKNYSALKDPAKRSVLVLAMSDLETHGWVIPVIPEQHKPGAEITMWRINPAVHDGRFAEIMVREKARRDAVRNAIAGEAARRRQTPTCADMRRQ